MGFVKHNAVAVTGRRGDWTILTLCANCKKELRVLGKYEDRNKDHVCDSCKSPTNEKL